MPPTATTTTVAHTDAPSDPARLTRWWLVALGLTLLWDLGGADLSVMHALGGPQGFTWRNQWLLSRVLHDAMRQLSTAFYLLIWLWALWPPRWARGPAALWHLPRRERVAVAVLVTLSLLVVSLIKSASQTSCPWDLQAFGGPAHYVSHWALGQNDGGAGRCFPGGHVSSAYGFLALCLPWLMPPAGQRRVRAPGWRWLGFFMLAGLVAGTVQTVRGAHYPSYTLWTFVISAGVALAGWRVAQRWLK